MKPLKRHRIEIGDPARIDVILAGCGGTGSFAALHLGRLAYEARRAGVNLEMWFVDPDTVEEKNIGRQNFCEAEIGLPKAHALASRYNLAFGLEIKAIQTGIGASRVVQKWRSDTWLGFALVIGAVDSPAARREIAAAVAEAAFGGQRTVWWLDAGNDEHSGQVLLGNGAAQVIDASLGCVELPWPGAQEPGIMADSPAASVASDGLSCAELLALNVQSLMINQAMAGWIGVYASRLLLARDLDIYQTWLDLRGGGARSVPVTGEVEAIKASGRMERQIGELGNCPNCDDVMVAAQNNYEDRGVIDIAFCPGCGWFVPLAEWQAEPRADEALRVVQAEVA